MQSEEQRLTLLLEERDQELQKAVELGHTLLGRISSLEKRETKHAAELSDVKKKHESLNSEYNALLNRFKNLDEINVAVKNERNKLSLELQEMRQSLIKEDAVSHERVMDNNTKLRSRVEQLETIIANLRLENQRREQREAVQTPTSPVKQSAMLDSFSKSPVAVPDVQVQELTQKNEELSKTIESATADNKKLVSKIEDLSNRVASLQTEKDMAQIQFRVQTNELRQEKEELKIKLSSYKPIGKKDLTDQLFHLEKLRQTLTDTKTFVQQQTEKFEGEVEQIQTVLGEMAGVPQSSSPTASRQFLEMSYALLQQKLIQELGLDDYFTSYGHNKPKAEKKGFLTIIYGMFSHTPRWVRISSSGLAIFRSERDVDPMELYSLQGAKVVAGQEGRFDLKLALRKKILFDAHQTKNREEWVTFIQMIIPPVPRE